MSIDDRIILVCMGIWLGLTLTLIVWQARRIERLKRALANAQWRAELAAQVATQAEHDRRVLEAGTPVMMVMGEPLVRMQADGRRFSRN